MHRRSRRLSGPGNFIFRTGEFEQWNGVLFEPATAPELAQYWIDILLRWYIDLVIDAGDLSSLETVYYAAGQQAAAQAIATAIGVKPTQVQPLTTAAPVAGVTGTDVVVVVGQDLASAANGS